MPVLPGSISLRYILAMAAVVLATAARLALDPLLGDLFPFATLFLAVLIVAGLGGRGPALLATGLGALASARFLLPPREGLAVQGFENQAGLVLYLAVGIGIALLGGAMRAARRRAEAGAEMALRQQEQLRITLSSIGDAVLVTDTEGRVTSMNPVAETLTGWATPEATDVPQEQVFRIVNEETRRAVEIPALRTLREGGIVGLANHTVLIARDGVEHPIDDSAAPIRDERGRVSGVVLIFRDVAQRRQQENLLRESEHRNRTILESISDAFFALGRDWRFIYVNRQAERLPDRRPGDLLGKVLWDEFPGLAGSEFERAFHRAMQERVAVSVTSYYSDHGRWYEVHCYPAPDGLSIYFRDVTDPKDAEERERLLLVEAATANAQFRAFFEQGALFAGIMAVDGTILEPNRLSLEACGYTREEVVGKPFWECPWWNRSAALAERIKAASAQAAAGETFRSEMPYFVADGGERMVDLIVLPIKDEAGRVVFLAPTGTDITERKRTEERARFQAHLLDTVGQAVIVTDPEGRITYWNRFAETLYGWGADEATGRSILEMVVTPEAVDRAAEIMGRMRAGESWSGEFLVRRRDGTTFPAFVTDTPVFDEGGSLKAIIGVSMDITERKQAEAALQEADRRKDEFLATLAHELRNPLAPIRNALHLMRRPGGDDEMEAEIAMAERQVGHLARMIDDLMDVARIGRGQIELHKEVVDLITVVGQAVETARPQIDERHHRLTVSLPGGPIRLEADPTRLEQILWNLLNNSAKYTEQGGDVWLTVEPEGGEVIVRVRDTGIGIRPEMLPNVFNMFMQVEDHKAHSQGGLGIGLSLVRTLVEMHGGSIAVRSEGPGRGSEFVVRLPTLAGAGEVTAPQQDRRRDPGEGPPRRRILVVDDNIDAAQSLVRLLVRLYHQEVRVAHDGPGALEVAGEFRPEVVLLEIGLPGMDGNEVTRQLREQPQFEGVLIVALTGWGQEEDRRRSQEAGFDHHLLKPVDPEALLELLAGMPAHPPAGDPSGPRG